MFILWRNNNLYNHLENIWKIKSNLRFYDF